MIVCLTSQTCWSVLWPQYFVVVVNVTYSTQWLNFQSFSFTDYNRKIFQLKLSLNSMMVFMANCITKIIILSYPATIKSVKSCIRCFGFNYGSHLQWYGFFCLLPLSNWSSPVTGGRLLCKRIQKKRHYWRWPPQLLPKRLAQCKITM